MFHCHQTLTVVNRTVDPRTDDVKVYPHVFTGCSLYSDHATVRERAAARGKAPAHKARFPTAACPGFAPPWEWAQLTDTERADSWTLDAETVIVPGGVAELTTWDQVQALKNKWTVTAWKDWTDTAFPHYYAEGE